MTTQKEISLVEVFEKVIRVEAKIDTIDQTNKEFLRTTVARFRVYSLVALFLVTINIIMTSIILIIILR